MNELVFSTEKIKNFLKKFSLLVKIRRFFKKKSTEELKRISLIMKPCNPLGKSGRRLESTKEMLVRKLIDEKQSRMRHFNPPWHSSVLFQAENVSAMKKNKKILFVMQEYIDASTDKIENDFVFNMRKSANDSGFSTDFFPTRHAVYEIINSELADQEIQGLLNKILEYQPNIVIFDGNFIGNDNRGMNTGFWKIIRNNHPDIKIIAIIPDSYRGPDDFLGYWLRSSDLAIIFNTRSEYYLNLDLEAQKKVMIFPSLPFWDVYFDDSTINNKLYDFCYVGSDSRNRKEFCSQVLKTDLNCKVVFHDRSQKKALTLNNYYRVLCQSKIVFNTGYLNAKTSLITGRSVEAIKSEALLLEESGDYLSDFFIPWIHFIPVSNSHEVAIYSQFFIQNEIYRQQIVKAAKQFHCSFYSADKFWSIMEKHVV